MKKNKFIAAVLAAAVFMSAAAVPAMAAAGDMKISLGADLNEEQRAEVLSLLSITEEDLAANEVVYVSNEEEHEYLDSYVSYENIGDLALSSSKVILQDDGYGINVTTYNISYCTEGMYENALLTAGIEDAEVYVAAPEDILGTAALVGIIKAYSEATGSSLNEENVEAAAQELAITSEIAQAAGADTEDVEMIIAELKTMLGEIAGMDDASVDSTIREVSEKYGVTFSDENVARIRELLRILSSLDVDGLLVKAQQFYESLTKLAEDAGGLQGIIDNIGGFLSGILDKISEWLGGLS